MLVKISHKLAEEIYKKSGAQGAQGTNGPQAQAGPGEQPQDPKGGGKMDDVIDAEYKVDDDKK